MNKSELIIKRYPNRLIWRRSGGMTYYLDQLEEYDGMEYPNNPEDLTWNNSWISSNFINRYLNKYYGITSREYWNILNGYSINYEATCNSPECNNLVEFRSLWRGYATTCCYECRDRYHSEELKLWYSEATEEERSSWNEKQHKWWWDDSKVKFLDIFGVNRYIHTSTKVISKLNYDNFLNYGNPFDWCQFYIAKTKNKFKFGIASNYSYTRWHPEYLKIKIINSGYREFIGKLEYFIKLDLDTTTEYLDWVQVEKFRSSYLKAISIIKEGSTTISTESTLK